jgi:hypothetical protein
MIYDIVAIVEEGFVRQKAALSTEIGIEKTRGISAEWRQQARRESA